MTRFSVQEKVFTIKGEEYKVMPLGGEHLPIMFRILKNMNKGIKKGMSDEELSVISEQNITEEVLRDMHTLCVVSLKKSYPKEDVGMLESFATQNMREIFSAVLEVNNKDLSEE